MQRVILLFVVLCAACSGGEAATASTRAEPTTTTVAAAEGAGRTSTAPTTTPPATTTPPTITTTTTVSPFARPAWLGTRLLPLRADEHGEAQPTPPELVDRRLATVDLLPPPPDPTFVFTIDAVSPEVAARSSWVPECPVSLEELRYVTVSHFGFDGKFHTGELIVNAAVAADIVGVFEALHEARFPIEQMRVVTKEEIDAHPTGDWNDTTAFVCRPAVGSQNWSQHAYGLAVDINPFHNPYLKGDLILPELATAYTDRDDARLGMVFAGDVVTEAFAEIGFGWGGKWRSLKDWMHFSQSGN